MPRAHGDTPIFNLWSYRGAGGGGAVTGKIKNKKHSDMNTTLNSQDVRLARCFHLVSGTEASLGSTRMRTGRETGGTPGFPRGSRKPRPFPTGVAFPSLALGSPFGHLGSGGAGWGGFGADRSPFRENLIRSDHFFRDFLVPSLGGASWGGISLRNSRCAGRGCPAPRLQGSAERGEPGRCEGSGDRPELRPRRSGFCL